MGDAVFGWGDLEPILLPLDPSQGANTKDNLSHTEVARIIDYNLNITPAESGAHLARRIDEEKIGILRLIAEDRKKPSNEGRLEIQRRLVRLTSLHDAVWALHMIDISQDPKVWKLLDQNAIELSRPGADITTPFQKAQETITSGDTRSLEAYIKEVVEKHARLVHPTRPVSRFETFMGRVPCGSAVLSRLKFLQRVVATKDTEESRLLAQDIMHGLWLFLEKKGAELHRVARK